MKKFNTQIAIFFLVFILSSCHKKEQVVNRSFYYWQTVVSISDVQKNLLEELDVKKMYFKFFDITWNENTAQPIPAADIIFEQKPPSPIEIVPVIFITNESLEKISSEDIKTLAFKICKKINSILEQNSLATPIEIQIDCDWNTSTKEKYFSLLKEMQKFPLFETCIWSATIRLHQIAHSSETGVPPVNRGALMFYNMGNIEDASTSNSIYDKAIAESYLNQSENYPLPLDAAIACFSWGLVYDHEKLIRIIYPLTLNSIDTQDFTLTKKNQFSANRDFYFHGIYMVKGNMIRLETMTPDLSKESAEQLSHFVKNDSLSVILYQFDSTIINTFQYEGFNTLYHQFE